MNEHSPTLQRALPPGVLLVDAFNRPIVSTAAKEALAAEAAAPAPAAPQLPTTAFLCRAHGRFFERRKVPSDTIREALVVVLLANARVLRLIRDGSAGQEASFAEIVAVLERVRPWCCYLASPERHEVVRIGTKGRAYVQAQLTAQREKAAQRSLVRTAAVLAGEYGVATTTAAYALESLGGYGEAMVRAALQGAAEHDSATAQRAAIDGLAAGLVAR